MAGAFPGAEFVAVAAVFVVHDGVEVVDLFHAGFDKATDGGGAFHPFAVVALHLVLCVVDSGAVVREVLHEVGREFVGDELRGDAGFGEFEEIGVGGGKERAVAGAGGSGEAVGETWFVLGDGAGGPSDILDVEAEGIEEHFLAGDAAALLTGFGGVEVFDDMRNAGEVGGGFTTSGEVGGVVFAEGGYAAKHVVAVGFSVVHGYGREGFVLVNTRGACVTRP